MRIILVGMKGCGKTTLGRLFANKMQIAFIDSDAYVEKTVLLKRILAQGVPAFFSYQDDPARSLDELLAERAPVYSRLADITIDASNEASEELIDTILVKLRDHGKNQW